MQIHILIQTNPGKNADNLMKVKQINHLKNRLLNDYGFNASIYFEKPPYEPHTYFLFFTDNKFELNKNESKNLILMSVLKPTIFENNYFNEYDFAAIVESAEIIKDNSLFYGKKNVVTNNRDFKCLKDLENDYCYISRIQKKGTLDMIVQYLIDFDETQQHI